jgi:hypothetical protein
VSGGPGPGASQPLLEAVREAAPVPAQPSRGRPRGVVEAMDLLQEDTLGIDGADEGAPAARAQVDGDVQGAQARSA